MTGVLERFAGHEQVVFGEDAASGLRCIIAVHSTALGPAVGGTRFRAYAHEDDALEDVLRLSRAMTYKNACAGLDAGGGKAVIIGDPAQLRSEALLRAYARQIASLNGRYVTACDVGTTPSDMATIRRETPWATGAEVADGGSGDSGVLTALGVFHAITACAHLTWGEADLTGRHVAVQGLGKVGSRLTAHLVDAGAGVSVADPSERAVARVADLPGVDVVGVEEILGLDADVLSPNALGAVLDEESVEQVRAAVVCGGANNQLATPEQARRLAERDVLYAPDYVVNAGGVINVAQELHPLGYAEERARRLVERIPATLTEVVETARAEGIDTETAASRVAERRIAAVGRLRGFWLP